MLPSATGLLLGLSSPPPWPQPLIHFPGTMATAFPEGTDLVPLFSSFPPSGFQPQGTGETRMPRE